MFATGMLGMVVMSGDRERDVRRVVSVVNEIGVGGLNLEVVMDSESSLQSLVNAAREVELPEFPPTSCRCSPSAGQETGEIRGHLS